MCLPRLALAAQTAAEAFALAGLPPLTVRCYSCVRCQQTHYEGDALYRGHLLWQSKHGRQDAPLWQAIWQRAEAAERGAVRAREG